MLQQFVHIISLKVQRNSLRLRELRNTISHLCGFWALDFIIDSSFDDQLTCIAVVKRTKLCEQSCIGQFLVVDYVINQSILV